MPGGRKILLQSLKERLVPFLKARGFEQLPLFKEDRKSGELRYAFPLGYMKRTRNEDFELIEIQLDKHGAASFVLNFGVVPPEGVTLPEGHFAQNEAPLAIVPEWYGLHSNRGGHRWFGFPWLTLDWRPESRAAKAVDRAIALYPEVEAWFERRIVGPHMRRVGYPPNKVGSPGRVGS